MKQTGLAGIVAVAFCATVAVAQSGNTTQQAPAQAQSGPTSAITVVGCVQPDEGGAAEATGTSGVTGSRAYATYVLTNITSDHATAGAGARAQTGAAAGQASGRAGQTGATAQPAPGKTATDIRGTAHPSARYTLEGHDMTEYAAQQVEVTGTVVIDPADSRPGQTGTVAANAAASAGQRIRVTNVRRLATSCPAQP
jgi:hypothetical protein